VKPVTFAPAARLDLLSIGDFIAADNKKRAVSFVEELERRCLKLSDFPEAARRFPALGPDARIVPFKGYVILYRVMPSEVSIERVLHGARDIIAVIDNS
jgi:toxin ParE1/3/4